MSKNFTCPKCKTRQQLKQLFFLTNTSVWRCTKCNTRIKPKKVSLLPVIVVPLLVSISGYYCMFVLDYNFWEIMAVGASFGILTFILSVVLYYSRVELEEV